MLGNTSNEGCRGVTLDVLPSIQDNVPEGLHCTCCPAYRTMFPRGYIGCVAQHTGQHLLSHMTPSTHIYVIEEKYINPAYMAPKAAFMILQLTPNLTKQL